MTDDVTQEPPETEEPVEVEAETPAPTEAEEEEGFIATLDGDPEPVEPEETPVLRDIRKRLREEQKARRDLERKLREQEQPQVADEPLPAKPTLESAGYDEGKFEADLLAWSAKKAETDKRADERRKEAEMQAAAWKQKADGYEAEKQRIRADDVDDVESAVREALNVTQQGIIVAGAKNPAALVYAIGKNQERLKELSAVKDPVQFAFAVARLETQMKIAPTKPPAPETRVSPSGRVAPVVNIEKLQADARKTGDYTAYRAAKKAAGL